MESNRIGEGMVLEKRFDYGYTNHPAFGNKGGVMAYSEDAIDLCVIFLESEGNKIGDCTITSYRDHEKGNAVLIWASPHTMAKLLLLLNSEGMKVGRWKPTKAQLATAYNFSDEVDFFKEPLTPRLGIFLG